mmetsp:Transcript_8500/g.26531  ORF Transcript_8500/g.26531 Transcript_8500/m.26531 type:complete len:251 (-) Transcript_8500:193-945(-)
MHATTIFVRRGAGGFEKIRWWGPLSDAALRRTVQSALVELEDVDDVELIDESSGGRVLLSESKLAERLSDGAMFRAEPGIRWLRVARRLFLGGGEAILSDDRPRRAKNDWNDVRFQRQVLKYERVLSHLASERTTLAWLRAALTMLAQGLSIWTARAAASGPVWIKPYLWLTALVYFVIVPVTVLLSLARWTQTKRALELRRDAPDFGHDHITLQAALLLVICVVAALSFAVVGSNDTVFAEFRPTNFFE